MKMGENFVNFADFEDNDELTNCRRLAKEIVRNVIDKAREEVDRQKSKQVQFEIKSTKITGKRPASLELNNLTPSIQIDLVPSRTPTPEEDNHVWIEQQQQTNKKKRKIRVKIIEEEDENELAEEEKVSKESNLKKKQEESINQTENKKSNSTTTKKKSSVSFSSGENEDRKIIKTEPNSKNSTKNIEQINDNQFSNEINKKTNSIKFDSSNENKLPNNKNELPNNIDKRSCKFAENENSINWPNYNNEEINKVASNFVQSLVEDAKKEADKRLKPSTSRTSGLYIEDKRVKEERSPWSLGRIREILSRLMRSTCLCKKSNTSGSIAEYV